MSGDGSARWDYGLLTVAVLAFLAWYFWPTSEDSMLQRLADAIYAFEDPHKNAVATKNNNPGNLKPPNGKAGYWKGQIGVSPQGFAIFDSFTAGMNALLGDLRYKATHHPEWSLQSLFNVWLGGGPNTAPPAIEGNAVNYAKFVADRIGAAVTDTLGALLGTKKP